MAAEEEAAKRAKFIDDFGEALPELVELPFKAVASKRGDHWLISEGSRDALCTAIKGCLESYLPQSLSRHLPLVGLVSITTVLVSSRVVEDVRLDMKRKKEASERGRPGPHVVTDAESPTA